MLNKLKDFAVYTTPRKYETTTTTAGKKIFGLVGRHLLSDTGKPSVKRNKPFCGCSNNENFVKFVPIKKILTLILFQLVMIH